MAAQRKNKLIFDSREYEFRNEKSFKEHNQGLYKLIKYIVENEKEELERINYLTRFIFEISFIDLLKSTLDLFPDLDINNISKDITKKIKNQNIIYSTEEMTRIISMVISVYIRHAFLIRYNFDDRLIKNFDFTLTKYEIKFSDTYNLGEKVLKQFHSNIGNFFNGSEVKEYIKALRDDDYFNDTSKFQKDIEYLESEKRSVLASEKEIEENKFDDIFKQGAYIKFEKWVKRNTDEPYKKFSFIFQRLNADKELRTSNFKTHTNWLLESDFINRTDFDNLVLNKGNWLTPSTILGVKRNKEYDMMTG